MTPSGLGPARRLPWKRSKVLRRVIVAGAGDGHVLGHDGVALLLELARDDCFERLRLDAEQLQRRAQRGRVGRELVAPGQLLHRHRTKLHAFGGSAGLDLFGVVDGAGPCLQQLQVAVHRVLIERNEHIYLVTHVAHRRLAGADRQKRMPAADDGLVGVVSVEMKTRAARRCGPECRRWRRCPGRSPRRWRPRNLLYSFRFSWFSPRPSRGPIKRPQRSELCFRLLALDILKPSLWLRINDGNTLGKPLSKVRDYRG